MTQDSGERVYLYIYDLSRGLARELSPMLIGRQLDGIWHTSVVCYGYEFYYGQGIFVTDRVGQTQYGTPIEIKDMGVTELPQEVFIEYVDSLREIYTAEKYHLLDNNCNTFTNDVCQFLVGKTIPGHISSLPEDFLNTPFGQSLRPMIDGAFTAPSRQLPQQSVAQPLSQTAPAVMSPATQNTVHYPSSPADFDTLVSSSTMAIAFFTSETCGPCKMIEPHYHSLSKSHTNIIFLQIDTHRAFSVSQNNNITATPTFKTYLNGHLHMEWKGASPSTLDSNLNHLLESAKAPLPPTLRATYNQSPILFPRSPPMDKVLPKLPKDIIPKPLLGSITTFLGAKGNTEVLVPPLLPWTKVIRDLDYSLENAWVVLDLLRAGMADKRISGWFAIDGLDVLAEILKNVIARDEMEWTIRVVTVQLMANMFSTPLLTVAGIRGFLPELIELLCSASLSKTSKLVKAAASALFNLSRLYLLESSSLGEDDIVQITVALVESLRTLLEKEAPEDLELVRLIVVCLGGFIVLGKNSESLKEVLGGVGAAEIIGGFKGAEGGEVVALITS